MVNIVKTNREPDIKKYAEPTGYKVPRRSILKGERRNEGRNLLLPS